ncbi:MAG: molecular chaperone TorD family protein [Anaerolineales bacterium]|nr:molecular chaperone TorD family protein [Anaerolineales bacterium]MCB9126602.1 molecular chaperone TorD family protein [Ardenticatenales bacterium]
MSGAPSAYAAAWSLLGELLLHGLTEQTLPTVRALPELAGHLSDSFEADEAAAAHYRLLVLNLFPYASSFLSDEGLLGGAISDQLLTLYRRYDFDVSREDVAADHLGLIALFLAQLATWQHAARHGDEQWLALQREVVTTQLLPWLPAFCHAVQRQAAPFYAALVDLTLQLALSLLPAEAVVPAPDLPLPVDPLAHERSGLREIAAFLTHAAQSGLFLSRDDIGRVAHDLDLPRGFGSRADTLENTMRSAAQYNALPALVAAWQRLWQGEAAQHAALAAAHPALGAVSATWRARLAHGEAMLARIAEAAEGRGENAE